MSEIEKTILEKLSSIEDRLASMETKFESVAKFFDEAEEARGIISGEVSERIGNLMGGLGILNPDMNNEEVNPDDLNDLLNSLKDFKTKLTSISGLYTEEDGSN